MAKAIQLNSGLFVLFALAGCRNATPPAANTGSREVITKYYAALAKRDWQAAYAELHADSRKRMDQASFERRAGAYLNKLGFVLDKVSIRSCDESGDQAIAQLYLSDAKSSAKHRFREGIVLKREGDAWRIVLPENFGDSLK